MDYRQMAAAMLSAAQRLRAVQGSEDFFAELPEVSGGETGTLLLLYHGNEPLHAGTLSKRLRLTTGRMAVILRTLEAKGLILRSHRTADKRMVCVELTKRGHELARQAEEQHTQRLSRLLKKLGEQDAAHLLRIMEKLGTAGSEELAGEESTVM